MDGSWRAARGALQRPCARRRGARRVLRHRRPRDRAARRRLDRAAASSAWTSRRRCSTPPRASSRRSSGCAATRWRCRSPTASSPPPRSASACATCPTTLRGFAELAPRRRPGGRVVCLELTDPPAWAAPFARLWTDRAVPLLGRLVARETDAYRYLPASVHRFPPADELAAIMGRAGPAPRALPAALGRRGGRACWYGPGMTAGAVAEVLEVPGLAAYVDAVEVALEEAVGWAGGSAVAGRRAPRRCGPAASGCGRCSCTCRRPSAGRERPGLVAAGCAVELVHMATLVHDDQLDAAPLRRGRPTVWAAHGERGRARDRRLPVRARVRRARRDRRHGRR